jgi:hypothetical protein
LEQFQAAQAAAGESLPRLAAELYGSTLRALWRRLSAPLPPAAGSGELVSRLRAAASAGLLPLPLVCQLVVAHLLHGLEGGADVDGPLARDGPLGSALRRPPADLLKHALAAGLTSADIGGLSGGTARTSVVLGARNDAALAALGLRLAAGDRRLALFYGAAHMPDLENSLAAAGWRRTGGRWLDAWRLEAVGFQPAALSPAAAVQLAMLAGFSALLGTDLALWEAVLRWGASAVQKA